MTDARRREIEFIARGICIRADRVLLCHSRGQPIFYLPGGHIEFGEGARAALEREVREELGRSSRAGVLVGALEHFFQGRRRMHAEVNLLFELRIAGLSAARAPTAAEPELEFVWAPLDRLAEWPLEPAPLRTLLPSWRLNPQAGAVWRSTIERRRAGSAPRKKAR